jgi:pteridine reductase
MKLALVTGGCRRVGARIAARLAGQGYALALHGHSEAVPEPELAAYLADSAARWHGFVADLADSEQLDALPRDVELHFGQPVDLLVNNASLFHADDNATPDMAALVDHFRVNAAAPFVLATAVAARATADRPVAIVNLLDQRIAHPHADQLAYTLSKQALAEVTRTLAATLAPRARVCGVAPGLTLPTPDYDAGQLDRLAAMMPLGRLPTPDDVADAVLYLAGAAATTGQVIFVDGGASLTRFAGDFVRLGRG